MYQLTGGEGSVDPESGRFQGPLTADPGITVEIRAGGPYIGFQQTTALAYLDDDILLSAVATDEQITKYASNPLLAVVAPQEKNPIMLMWDPATYDFESISDIGKSDAVVNVFPGQFWIDFFIGTGQLREEQIDGSYDGSATRFIAEEGALVQQGFATQEPWNYQNLFEDWAKPVEFTLSHDAGYEIYASQLAIRPDKLDGDMDECLRALVPVIQQSAVDFGNDPGPVNDAIVQAVTDLASFWTISPESAANTVVMMDQLGILSNGPDDTIGNFDMARIQSIFDLVADLPAFDFPEGLTPEDLATNEYIDMSIGR